jgi:hypothetical protein
LPFSRDIRHNPFLRWTLRQFEHFRRQVRVLRMLATRRLNPQANPDARWHATPRRVLALGRLEHGCRPVVRGDLRARINWSPLLC